MEPQEIRRQINLLDQAGMAGGFMHARVGLLTKYMEKEWFDAADAAVDEAAKLGIKMFLYDEDKWPSGFAAGAVPIADERFRMKALIARPLSQSAPVHNKPVGSPVDNLQVYIYTSPLGYDRFNGTCYADLMNSDAMDFFLRQSYQPYYDRFEKRFGNVIPAEFTDEPCVIYRARLPVGAVPYSDALPQRFREMFNYDPIDSLHLLFTQTDGAKGFRLDYFRAVNSLFEENFSKKLGDWCSNHGIELTGHFMSENSLYDQQLWGTKVMANYRHLSMPGIDHLCRQIDERITAKQCHSVVNQFDKKRMLSELYGASGQNLSFEDRFWIAAQQICLGVTMLNPHLSLYTMSGCRKRDYPPNIFYQQPWWPVNKAVDEPLSRMCVAMSQGQYHAESLIIHPQESTFILWQSKTDLPSGEQTEFDFQPTVEGVQEQISGLDAQVKSVMNILLGAQRTFDFGDETIIASDGKITVKNEIPYITIGCMDYPLVILPGMITIAETTFELLRKFKNLDGPIIGCGQRPSLIDGINSAKLEKWLLGIPYVEPEQLAGELKKIIPSAVEIISTDNQDTAMVWTHIRDLANSQRLVYLANLNRLKDANIKIRFAGRYSSLKSLNIWTGDIENVNEVNESNDLLFETSIAPAEAIIFLLSKEDQDHEACSCTNRCIKTVDLSKMQSKFSRLDENAIILDYVLWHQGDGKWSSASMPIIMIQKFLNDCSYIGPLSLRYAFMADVSLLGHQILLILEHPEYYHITVNGSTVEYQDLPSWRDPRWLAIAISSLIVKGENIIELHCNRFEYGDLANVDEPQKRYGTEIEAVYLVGDFGVNAAYRSDDFIEMQWNQLGLPPVKQHKLSKDSAVLTAPSEYAQGDVTVQGLPFYAGRLQTKIRLPIIDLKTTKEVYLRVDTIDCPCVEVLVNGVSAGYLIGKMSMVDITKFIPIAKELDLIFYGSLRNLLGPHHHIDGELVSVGPHSFEPHFETNAAYSENVNNWMVGKAKLIDWVDEYNLVSFGLISGLRLELNPIVFP